MSYGAIELLKWAAFVAMLADHWSLIVLDGGLPWLRDIGRFAFPAFALAFGHGLGLTSDPRSVGRRLIAPAIVAGIAWLVIGDHFPANVLLVFAVAAFSVDALSRWPAAGIATLAVVVLTTPAWEGGLLGLALVLGAAGRARWRSRAWILAAAAWCYLHPSVGAIVACAAYFVAPHVAPIAAVRARWLAWGYAAHLGAFAAISAATWPTR